MRKGEIRVLFEQGGQVPWVNLTVGVLLVGAMWGNAPARELLAWLAAVLLVNLVRASIHRRFVQQQPSDDELAGWGRWFVLGSASAGLLWGLASVLFFSTSSLLPQTLLTFAVGGMTAAAAGTLACHLPAFYAFFVPALAPLALRTLAEGDRLHLGMGAMLLAYGAALPRVAFNNYEAFARAFRLSTENALLLERVSRSQRELQETNRTLERRVLERTRELEGQAAALQRAQRLEVAGRLAGGLAHDFNSLLTVITNNARQLRESPLLDEQSRLAAEETLQAGQRGIALIRHLLAVTRSKLPEPRAFALGALLEEWSALLRLILGEGFSASVELSPEASVVLADPAQVEQVLVNLITSSRAGLAGCGKVALSTRVIRLPPGDGLEGGSYVELLIERIEAEAKRPFLPYLSLEADSRPPSFGLASLCSTAEHWGGRISIVQEDRERVRFRVLFPLPSVAPAQPSVEHAASVARPGDATILVVDDEPTLRSVIRRCLTREGYNVLVAEDGERALELAAKHPEVIHLLLTDVVMPGLTGLELAAKLQAARPTLAVLFISGFTFDEAVPAPDLTRGTAYLPKPFDTKSLTGKVKELLFAAG